jgi:hypothetical protein
LDHFLAVAPDEFRVPRTVYRNDYSAPDDDLADNVVVMGMEEMLAAAGDENSETSVSLFVNGKLPDGRFVKLDIQRDSRPVIPSEIQISFDIDSLIWVTRELRFTASMKLHLIPIHRDLPPIYHSNQISVEVLLPQSDADRANGGRNEWRSKSIPLRDIPQEDFGEFGGGTGQGNIYVFFPRMIHRQPNSGYMANLLPAEIKRPWFEQIVMPAFKKVCSPGALPYVTPSTIAEWKDLLNPPGSKGHKVPKKTVPVDPNVLEELQVEMKKIIDADPKLDMYGSFFFVYDTRGIKLSTTAQTALAAWNKLRYTDYTYLDWDYMTDKRNGLFVADFGTAFTPCTEEHLTGFWDHWKTLLSFERAGMNKPNIYPVNTMSGFASLQGAMSRGRKRATEFVWRSLYHHSFELFRRPGEPVYTCEDFCAHHVNMEFSHCWDGISGCLHQGQTRSYGVRDEVRIGGRALTLILPDADAKVLRNAFTLPEVL